MPLDEREGGLRLHVAEHRHHQIAGDQPFPRESLAVGPRQAADGFRAAHRVEAVRMRREHRPAQEPAADIKDIVVPGVELFEDQLALKLQLRLRKHRIGQELLQEPDALREILRQQLQRQAEPVPPAEGRQEASPRLDGGGDVHGVSAGRALQQQLGREIGEPLRLLGFRAHPAASRHDDHDHRQLMVLPDEDRQPIGQRLFGHARLMGRGGCRWRRLRPGRLDGHQSHAGAVQIAAGRMLHLLRGHLRHPLHIAVGIARVAGQRQRAGQIGGLGVDGLPLKHAVRHDLPFGFLELRLRDAAARGLLQHLQGRADGLRGPSRIGAQEHGQRPGIKRRVVGRPDGMGQAAGAHQLLMETGALALPHDARQDVQGIEVGIREPDRRKSEDRVGGVHRQGLLGLLDADCRRLLGDRHLIRQPPAP